MTLLERLVGRGRGRRGLRRFSPERAKAAARPGRPQVLEQRAEKLGVALAAGALATVLLGAGADLDAPGWAGLAALVLVTEGFFVRTLLEFQRGALRSLPRVIALAVTLLLPLLLAHGLELLLGARRLPLQPLAALPLALVGLVLALAWSRVFALICTVFTGALLGLFALLRPEWGDGLRGLAICLAGAFMACLASGHVRRRVTLARVGLLVGLVQTLVAGSLLLFQPGGIHEASQLWFLLLLAVEGLATGVLVSGSLPAIELLFDVTTDVSLLELGNTHERPLLRKLLLEAPGTYHHSYIVGLLAEAAAEAVGGNPLLARVGALYHDVGKLNKPSYFAENAPDARFRHRELAPELSTLIISSHTRDGVELGTYYGLPSSVLAFMTEHHGTSCIEYFFDQAKKLRGAAQVDESDFRYTGARPQRPETAIVMIADAVEAISRQMPEPTPQRLASMVHEVTMKRLTDRQFDECALTFRDLARIEEACVRVLTGIYHARPTWPKGRPHPLDLSQPAEQRAPAAGAEAGAGTGAGGPAAPRAGKA